MEGMKHDKTGKCVNLELKLGGKTVMSVTYGGDC